MKTMTFLDDIKGLIVDTVIDIGKGCFLKWKEEKSVRERIEKYLGNQRKYNETVSVFEELDFEGLCEFFQSKAFREMLYQYIDGEKAERAKAQKSLHAQAIAYSSARTPGAEKRTAKHVMDICNIIKSFFVSQCGHGEHILASRIEDTILEDSEKKHQELMESMNALKTQQNLSLDAFAQAIKIGNIEKAKEVISQFLAVGSTHHPLKKYYRMGMTQVDGEEEFVSTPISQEAVELYPPHIKLSGTATMAGKQIAKLNREVLDYSFRHQEPIYLEVEAATKFLGNIQDPYQAEAKMHKGEQYVIIPPRISNAFLCELIVDDVVYYNNIVLEVIEIHDDGTFIISNNKQEGQDIYVRIEARGTEIIKTSVNVSAATSKQMLLFDKFLLGMSKASCAKILLKEAEKVMLQWKPTHFDCESSFSSIDEEIDFYERLVEVEDYFKITFEAECVFKHDYDMLLYISDLLRGNTVEHTWSSFSITEEVTDSLKRLFTESKGEFSSVFGPAEIEDQLLGKQISFKLYRFLDCARIKDFERKRQQIELSDLGETVKLTFEPFSEPGQAKDVSEEVVFSSLDDKQREELIKQQNMVLIHTINT